MTESYHTMEKDMKFAYDFVYMIGVTVDMFMLGAVIGFSVFLRNYFW
jgi:hypothetical protein